MFFHNSLTSFALDLTAPLELALAALCVFDGFAGESSLTAHEVTSVQRFGVLVTQTPHSAQRAGFLVRLTEVGAGLHVDEVLVCVRLELRVERDQFMAGGVVLHFCGAVELVLQNSANV